MDSADQQKTDVANRIARIREAFATARNPRKLVQSDARSESFSDSPFESFVKWEPFSDSPFESFVKWEPFSDSPFESFVKWEPFSDSPFESFVKWESQ